MKTKRPPWTRRRFFCRTAAAVAGAAAAGFALPRAWAVESPAILKMKNPNSRIQIAVVGLGGISAGHMASANREEALVALCECRPRTLDARVAWLGSLEPFHVHPRDMKKFADYREMLGAMGDRLDAVIVCTPDHNHAVIGLDSIRRGKHVLIEKPLTHNIHEAITLREAAREHRVASQMGNEGRSWHQTPLAIEYLWSGAIGPVREVHHWCERAIGGDETGLRVEPIDPVPEEHRLWSVPVAEEEAYVRYVADPASDPLGRPGWGWRGDRRYGNGSLGDWAPHIMDVAYSGLKIGAAPRCRIEMLDRLYGGERLHFKTEIYKWTLPERDDMPELVQYWYSGIRPNTDPEVKDADGNVAASVQNMPSKVVEVMRRYGQDLGEFGTLYVGEKGYMFTGMQGGGGLRFLPASLQGSIPQPPQMLPRAKGDNNTEWYHAIRTGEPSTAEFDYAAGFTEHYLSGVLASRVPLGTVIEYDRVSHKVLNVPELNRCITRRYRDGYEVG